MGGFSCPILAKDNKGTLYLLQEATAYGSWFSNVLLTLIQDAFAKLRFPVPANVSIGCLLCSEKQKVMFDDAVQQINTDPTILANTTLVHYCATPSPGRGTIAVAYEHFIERNVMVGTSANAYGTELYANLAREARRLLLDVSGSTISQANQSSVFTMRCRPPPGRPLEPISLHLSLVPCHLRMRIACAHACMQRL